MGYPITKNQMKEGGDQWVVGGELVIEADGLIDRGNTPDPGEGVIRSALMMHYQAAPDAASSTAVHVAVTLADGEATTVDTGITNPDVPRNVTVKGNQAGVAGNVVFTGTDMAGTEITETIALNGAAEVAGALAFATVTEIVMPARVTEGDTVSVGIGKKIGIPHVLEYAGCLLAKLFDGSTDSGAMTAAAGLAGNVFAVNGAPNGAKVLDLYYLI